MAEKLFMEKTAGQPYLFPELYFSDIGTSSTEATMCPYPGIVKKVGLVQSGVFTAGSSAVALSVKRIKDGATATITGASITVSNSHTTLNSQTVRINDFRIEAGDTIYATATPSSTTGTVKANVIVALEIRPEGISQTS